MNKILSQLTSISLAYLDIALDIGPRDPQAEVKAKIKILDLSVISNNK